MVDQGTDMNDRNTKQDKSNQTSYREPVIFRVLKPNTCENQHKFIKDKNHKMFKRMFNQSNQSAEPLNNRKYVVYDQQQYK